MSSALAEKLHPAWFRRQVQKNLSFQGLAGRGCPFGFLCVYSLGWFSGRPFHHKPLRPVTMLRVARLEPVSRNRQAVASRTVEQSRGSGSNEEDRLNCISAGRVRGSRNAIKAIFFIRS
jgi:hypothetical protein